MILSAMPLDEDQSEETRLINNEVLFGEVKLKYPKWLCYIILMAVIFSQVYSVVSSIYTMNQYSYYAFMEDRYPERSTLHISSGGKVACSKNKNTSEYKQQVMIQKLSSEWNIYCALAQNIPAFFLNLNLATYSDVYGRKLFFIVPFVGTFLKNMCCSAGIYFKINIQWFILFYFIEGCTGVWASTVSMAFCFIADTTPTGKHRSFIIGVVETGLGIGVLISSSFTGYLIKWTGGYLYPEIISVGVVAIGLFIVIFALPETLHESRKRGEVSFLENMKRATECYRTDFSPLGKRWKFLLLIFIFIMSTFANLGKAYVEPIYQLNAPFCWSSVEIGWYGAVRTVAWSFGGIIMIKIFHIFTTDETISFAAFITTVVSSILEGIAKSGSMLYIAAVSSIGSIVTLPMVRGIMSRMTPAHKQGSVFAGIAAVEVLCSMGANISANAVYDATVSYYRGITFFVMAGYATIGLIFNIILIIGHKKYPVLHSTQSKT